MALCKDNLEKISAYVDSELSSSEAAVLEAHMAACALCSEVLRATREEKRLLAGTFSSMRAPATLAGRIHAVIGEEVRREGILREQTPGESPRGRVPFFRRFFSPGPAWAAVSLVFVLIAGTIYLRTEGIILPAGEKATTAGLYVKDIAHDAYLIQTLPERPYDLQSRSPVETEAFLSEHVGFDVHVPDLAAAGYRLRGGRIWHTIARISALIVFEDSSGNTVSLFEVKREHIGMHGAKRIVADGREFYMGDAYGFSGVVWMQENVAFGLAGDLPNEKLIEIARAAAASLGT
jgi:anti-sigma factor RsiW